MVKKSVCVSTWSDAGRWHVQVRSSRLTHSGSCVALHTRQKRHGFFACALRMIDTHLVAAAMSSSARSALSWAWRAAASARDSVDTVSVLPNTDCVDDDDWRMSSTDCADMTWPGSDAADDGMARPGSDDERRESDGRRDDDMTDKC